MTKQQQQLVEDNMNLVYFVIRKKFPHFIHDEDLVQAGMLGLCKAGKHYDATKGTFSTFAYKCILGYIYKELNSRDASKDVDIVSLNVKINDEADKDIELGETIVGESDIEYAEIDQLYNKVSDFDRRIIELRRQGFNNPQIAKKLGYSQQHIQQRLRKLKRMYDRMYGG